MRKLGKKKIDGGGHQHDHDGGDELFRRSRPRKRHKPVVNDDNTIITSSTTNLLIHPTKLCQWLLHKFLPTSFSSSSNSSLARRRDDVLQTSSKYDVFISFRGVDVRNSFLSHLYSHLNDYRKLAVYKDDVDLERGEQISPALLLAIERSDVYIVILSPKYADSRWCLEELEKILQCMKLYRRRVIPVFYGVDPSGVENQRLPSSSSGNIRSWRAALEEIANISGFDSQVIRPETKLIEEIVKAVFQAIHGGSKMVRFSSYAFSRGLVGLECKIEQVEALMCLEGRGNRTIGLWGMAGVGKTALAKAFFDLFSCQFQACYFFSNFADTMGSGSSSRRSLQHEFFSKLLREDDGVGGTLSYELILRRLGRVKALVVIDDVGNEVGDIGPLKDLFNGQYCNLFGPGSVIIVTGRNRQLLKSVCHHVYEVEALHRREAFQLFCLHAFKGDIAKAKYGSMVGRAISYASGNPLAVTVLGAHLHDRDLKFWDRELGALQDNDPNSVVENVLRRSYDGLSRAEKDIFLDLACFFYYWCHTSLEDIEDVFSQGRRGNLITNLVDKCLISIDPTNGRCIEMNLLLRNLGRDIVNEERRIEKRSRLWKRNDVHRLFLEEKGARSIECISLYGWGPSHTLKPDAFVEMENLRFLVIGDNVNLIPPEDGLTCLPNALRILEWHSFASKCLPFQFSAENLVRLDLQDSKIEKLWEEGLNVDFGNLKFLILDGSKSLRKLPNLSTAERLKEIDRSLCTSLVELPTSILDLPKLEFLNVSKCSNLKWDNLEGKANSSEEQSRRHSDILPNLRKLDLSKTPIQKVPNFITRLHILVLLCKKCTKLTEFPVISSLERLTVTASLIKEVVELEKLSELKYLNLSNNKQLVLFSGDCSKLKSLEKIKLGGCSKLSGLPDSTGNLIHLQRLYLSCTAVTELPSSIGDLVRLSRLILTGCKNLASLPNTLHKLPGLDRLDLVGCDQLRHLPELPSRLENLDAHGCKSLHTVSIGVVEKPDFSDIDWCFAQCWKLDPGVCSKLVDKFARDSIRTPVHAFCRSRLLLPAKWGSEGSGEEGSTMVTAKLRGQPWESKWTVFCALLNCPDPLLVYKFTEFVVQCVMLNNTGAEVVLSECFCKTFRYEDQEEEEQLSDGHFLVWSTTGPLVPRENADDDGSTLEFFFRSRYKTKMDTVVTTLIKNCRVIPVYNDRVVTNEDDEEEDDDEYPNNIQGLYDQLCSHR